ASRRHRGKAKANAEAKAKANAEAKAKANAKAGPLEHRSSPVHMSNRFSLLGETPAEKPVERALVIGDSILRHVKIASRLGPPVAVSCIPGARAPDIRDGSTVEIVKSTKFLGVHLAEDVTWCLNTSNITRKAQQRLYFLRRLRKAHLPPPILTTFYRGTIESILSSCITAWFGNCTASDGMSLQRVVRTAEKIICVSLLTVTDIYTTRCIRKATSIVDDHTHPSHTLFTLLPSGKRYQHWPPVRAVSELV
ncbi:hypothetical protein NFI96_031460, partial [Prochilodus magdalenae]